MHAAIDAFRDTPRYHACLLIVHPEIRRLADATNEIDATYGWPHLSIGRELSRHLLTVSPAQRPWVAREWFEAQARPLAPGPLLCTEIDLFFEPSLDLDPLWLLRHTSRATTLIVAWPGTYHDEILAYAVPGHAHYRTWRQPDVAVTVLD